MSGLRVYPQPKSLKIYLYIDSKIPPIAVTKIVKSARLCVAGAKVTAMIILQTGSKYIPTRKIYIYLYIDSNILDVLTYQPGKYGKVGNWDHARLD